MKFIVTIIALIAISSKVSMAQQQQSNNNPTICPYVYDPVLCGRNNREFSNQCEATNGGFRSNQCRPKPEGNSPTICPELYNPVLCGRNDREFSNQCEATNGGFPSNQCRPKPEGNSPTICPYTYDPVVCGQNNREFSNQCEATNGGFRSNQCRSKPKGNSPTICPELYNPRVCGRNNLEFSNPCEATNAGFQRHQCIGKGRRSLSSELNIDGEDIAFDKSNADNNSTTIGEEGHLLQTNYYDADYIDDEECDCPTVVSPVKCVVGEVTMFFNNMCVAESFGFKEEEEECDPFNPNAFDVVPPPTIDPNDEFDDEVPDSDDERVGSLRGRRAY